MFNKRKISFEREVHHVDKNQCETIRDDAIIRSAIDIANYYNLQIIKINLSDFFTCKIVLKGDKQNFHCFVSKFLKQCGKYLKEVTF